MLRVGILALICLFFSTPSVAMTDAMKCYRALKSLGKKDATPLTRKEKDFERLFAGWEADGPGLVRAFGAQPDLRATYQMDAGVSEKITIGAHTQEVFDVYNDQYRHFGLDKLKVPADVSLPRVIKAALALHDIGKPAAIQSGDKNRQYEYSATIMRQVLGEIDFSPAEIELAVALVDHDAIGKCLRKESSADQAHGKLVRSAERAGMSAEDFFKLQTFFYTCDAASYTYVRSLVFSPEDSGRLSISAPQFRGLAATFNRR